MSIDVAAGAQRVTGLRFDANVQAKVRQALKDVA